MKDYIELLKNMDLGDSAAEENIIETERIIGIKFPSDYIDFMKLHNGAEGNLGDNSYLALWTIEEIPELNEEYGVSEYTPGLVYIGSDGGEMAYAFDLRNEKACIVEFPMDSIHIEDAVFISYTFDEFIYNLFNRKEV